MVRLISSLEEYKTLISKAGGRVIVDFFADWCGPCRVIGPKFETWSTQHPNIEFVKVNVDESGDITESEGITAMPTFKGYKNGQLIDSIQGANETKIQQMIKKLNE